MNLWLRGLARSFEKLKPLYLFYHSSYGHQIGWDWKVSTHIKSYDALIMRSFKITWQRKTIRSPLPECLRPPTLAGWWLTFSRLPHIKLLNPLFTWQIKTFISPSLQSLGPPKLVGWWLTLTGTYWYSWLTLSLHGLTSSCDKLKTCFLLPKYLWSLNLAMW